MYSNLANSPQQCTIVFYKYLLILLSQQWMKLLDEKSKVPKFLERNPRQVGHGEAKGNK